MRKIAVAVLLLSLFAISHVSIKAQSRARRVGATNPPPATAPTPNAPERQPKLNGANTSNAPAARPRANNSTTAPEEVGDGDVVRVNTTLVTMPVSVLDRNGTYVPDIRQSEFHIWEDGVEQDIAYFATIEKPFTVALVLDTSGSTHFRLEEIQDAAIAFVNQLRSDDRVLVASFDDDIRILAEPTSDRAQLRNAIRRTHTGGGTRLYDAIDMVVNQRLNRIEGRKAIVLFTDGVDTTSKHASYQSNVRDAEELDALIYPVEFDTYEDTNGQVGGGVGTINLPSIIMNWPFPFPMPGGRRRGGRVPIGTSCSGCSREDYERGDAYLHDLARVTGSRLYRADTTSNLAQAFSQIADELRRQYSLGYYPKPPPQTGQRRRIKVRVMRPNLVVQARDSYIYNPSGATAAQSQDEQRRTRPVLQKKNQLARN